MIVGILMDRESGTKHEKAVVAGEISRYNFGITGS